MPMHAGFLHSVASAPLTASRRARSALASRRFRGRCFVARGAAEARRRQDERAIVADGQADAPEWPNAIARPKRGGNLPAEESRSRRLAGPWRDAKALGSSGCSAVRVTRHPGTTARGARRDQIRGDVLERHGPLAATLLAVPHHERVGGGITVMAEANRCPPRRLVRLKAPRCRIVGVRTGVRRVDLDPVRADLAPGGREERRGSAALTWLSERSATDLRRRHALQARCATGGTISARGLVAAEFSRGPAGVKVKGLGGTNNAVRITGRYGEPHCDAQGLGHDGCCVAHMEGRVSRGRG